MIIKGRRGREHEVKWKSCIECSKDVDVDKEMYRKINRIFIVTFILFFLIIVGVIIVAIAV